MNVEDSYEGAVRRLNRLGRAGIDLAPPPMLPPENDDSDRMRDLEELATLACEENERLKQELGGARREIERLQRLAAMLQEIVASTQSDESSAAPDESAQLSHELVGARSEIERLQRLVATLQEGMAGAQADEPFSDTPKKRGAAFYFVTLVFVGGAAVLLFLLRPWERHPIAAIASEPAQPIAPVVVAPAPKVEPIIPKAEPIIPKADTIIPKAAVVPKVEPVKVASPKAVRRHAAKHHASKSARHKQPKHGSVAKSKLEPRGDDPLGGLNM